MKFSARRRNLPRWKRRRRSRKSRRTSSAISMRRAFPPCARRSVCATDHPDVFRVNDSLKTWAWRTLITLAILIVIGACFYAEENARGLRVWQKCEREITARGESLNWNDYLPAPVPDDQNFYKAALMAGWFVRKATNTSTSTLGAGNPETIVNEITELSASNYLAWSTAFEPDYEKIRDALKRPAARMDGDYTRAFFQPVPNFVNYRLVSQVMAHRT